MWRTRGILLMQNSPRPRSEAPSHDDMNTPMRKMKVIEVTNPRPAKKNMMKLVIINCRGEITESTMIHF